MKYAMSFQKGDPDVKTKLKKTSKGIGLFANKDIKKGEILAYYKCKVILEGKRTVKNRMYTISVYTKNGNPCKKYVGDLYSGSLEEPIKGVAFTAYFSNEPSVGEKTNAYIDNNLKNMYKDRSRLKEGDIYIFRLRASKNIEKGEEILWCYGYEHDPGYKSPCRPSML